MRPIIIISILIITAVQWHFVQAARVNEVDRVEGENYFKLILPADADVNDVLRVNLRIFYDDEDEKQYTIIQLGHVLPAKKGEIKYQNLGGTVGPAKPHWIYHGPKIYREKVRVVFRPAAAEITVDQVQFAEHDRKQLKFFAPRKKIKFEATKEYYVTLHFNFKDNNTIHLFINGDLKHTIKLKDPPLGTANTPPVNMIEVYRHKLLVDSEFQTEPDSIRFLSFGQPLPLVITFKPGGFYVGSRIYIEALVTGAVEITFITHESNDKFKFVIGNKDVSRPNTKEIKPYKLPSPLYKNGSTKLAFFTIYNLGKSLLFSMNSHEGFIAEEAASSAKLLDRSVEFSVKWDGRVTKAIFHGKDLDIKNLATSKWSTSVLYTLIGQEAQMKIS